MASNYSQKTAISLYKFDTEDNYRQWLEANQSSSEYHDILAIVKNPDLNNGLDLFFNGHSLTKTRVYIQKSNKVVEVKSIGEDVFLDTKQYIIKKYSRRGQGQKNILVLEEYDIDDLVNRTVDSAIQEFSDTSLKPLVEQFMDEYFETHPIQQENADTKKFQKMLTNTHYIFRKLFSLIYNERAIHLGLELYFKDSENNILSSSTNYTKGEKNISKFYFKVTGAESHQISFEYLKLYKNDSVILTINGSDLTPGINAEYSIGENILNADTTYKAELKYKVLKLINTTETNNIENFPEVASYKAKDETIQNSVKFYITKETPVTPPASYNKGYLYFIPTDYDSDGYTILKSPFDSLLDSNETINWFNNSSKDYIADGLVSENFSITNTSSFNYAYSIPTANANYQMYVLVPYPNQITTTPTGGFADSITEICDIKKIGTVDYALYKQGFAQQSGNQFVLNLKS